MTVFEAVIMCDYSACGRDPDVSAGEFGENVEGAAAVLGRARSFGARGRARAAETEMAKVCRRWKEELTHVLSATPPVSTVGQGPEDQHGCSAAFDASETSLSSAPGVGAAHPDVADRRVYHSRRAQWHVGCDGAHPVAHV